MTTLRERCEKLMAYWNMQEIEDNRKNMLPDLEAFAREIRNEALEECAKLVEYKLSIYSCTRDAHGLPEYIRSHALAAKADK